MVFGTFDGIHRGHIHLLTQAKKYGDELIVVIARDKRVKQLKKRETLHSEKERKIILEHINLIDKVILGDTVDVYKVIKKEKPDTIVLGYDQNFFVDKLKGKLEEFRLSTKIIRAKRYKNGKHKSSLLRKMIRNCTIMS